MPDVECPEASAPHALVIDDLLLFRQVLLRYVDDDADGEVVITETDTETGTDTESVIHTDEETDAATDTASDRATPTDSETIDQAGAKATHGCDGSAAGGYRSGVSAGTL